MATADISEIESRTMGKISRRIVPFLMFCYFIAYLDRVNVGFAGATMSKDLNLTAEAFGGAAGIFFIAYFFFEIPSNILLNKLGAKLWIARIMFTWGLVSGAQAFVTGELSFNIVRLLLGVAEAGFFPGIIFFLTLWFPSAYRARIVGIFMVAIPVSTVIGAPISGFVLDMEGVAGLHGWQWMYIIEGIPALLLAFAVYFYLTNKPADAKWLEPDEREWIQKRLDAERANRESIVRLSLLQSIVIPRVLLLGCVYMALNIPQYGLSFFLPQIVKAFGVTNVQAGFITALPYVVGAIGMILWGRHSDKTGDRVWHVVISFAAMVVGLGLAAWIADPTAKIAVLCIAAWGFFSILPVFWTLPTAFLSGIGAAAGIATVNSVGNLGGYFGPKIFGYLKTNTGGDTASLIFLACSAIVGIILVLSLGHNRALERSTAAPAE
jgi:D-galactonate transporter